MKSAKYFLISLLAIVATHSARACFEPWYSPGTHCMYRVYEEQTETQQELTGCYPGSKENCLLWQQLTSKSIPIDDIFEIVYAMLLEDYEAIYNNPTKSYENRFVEWITKKDTAILDFLLVAKTVEYIRLEQNSRWYYPTMKTRTRSTLDELAQKALAANDKRLRDRYLLQAVRALFSLGRYQECVELWDNEIKLLPKDNLMRILMQPYIEGANFREKRSEKAIEYFAEIGDIQSVLFCSGQLGKQLSAVDALELICKYVPDSRHVERELQELIREYEPRESGFDAKPKFKATKEFNKLYSLCLKMAYGNKSKNRAMWFYTASYLAELKGESRQASYLLGMAENLPATDFLQESIKVFRIYLDAKLLPYDEEYDKKLYAQLMWLDKKIEQNIDDEAIHDICDSYKFNMGLSFYYWNDVMRRIILFEVCPRMIEAGKTTRALQLANMADNRLLNVVNRIDVYEYKYDEKSDKSTYVTKSLTMQEYRYSNRFNEYDYSNYFFQIIDHLDADAAIKYIEDVKHPQSAFDRFLNTRGYIGDDYLYDIAGTLCLREMRYCEATQYLKKVSPAFKDHLNVLEYMKYDPFEIERKRKNPRGDFRYEFAQEMYSLEQSIGEAPDPDSKAKLMLKYAIGLKNSFGKCWCLTQYYKGYIFWGLPHKREWHDDVYTRASKIMTKNVIDYACSIASDEVAAEIQYIMCNYKTVATQYPNTATAARVRGHCDNLKDYHAETKIE